MKQAGATQPRILFLDIETFPLLGRAWGVYETNILWVEKPIILCCFSAKWLGGKQITRALPDYPGYRQGKENDKRLIQDIWKLLDNAEIVVAQNGDNFDIKMINTEFLKHNLPPPSPYKTVDTLKVARRVGRFPSNKLDDLGDDLQEGRKLEHEGKGLWRKCLEGHMPSWRKMKRYNAQDVLLLERVYKRFVPWIANHPQKFYVDTLQCENCRSYHLQFRGSEITSKGTFKKVQCRNCGKWKIIKPKKS